MHIQPGRLNYQERKKYSIDWLPTRRFNQFFKKTSPANESSGTDDFTG